jgi:alpha-tubulin suppressor-like RCC1 family protein
MSHTCGVQTDDTLWCWGANSDGQLGDGTRTDRVVPTQIGAGTSWREVRVGAAFTCASTIDQRLACWGSNHEGQLGLGTAWSTTFQPVVP